ncbi:hypothetical protein LEP1GSC170_1105 [Leptospira interrogans serovar Bataviae str. HAI135]|nr:hypothetical protein LEP1GSC170_1105 [Leptospira interrogans serovar Bataviae str. HAI135]
MRKISLSDPYYILFLLKIWFNMDLALLSTRSFSFFPPYAELTLI